jgi:transposase
MNPFPMGTGVKVWLSTGHTDMRCGFPSLALRVQEVLKHDPLGGALVLDPQPADVQDRDGAIPVLRLSRKSFPFVAKAFADMGYSGDRPQNATLVDVEIVRKPKDQVGFAVHPKRWVVERVFAWISRNRRLWKDPEATIKSAKAFLYAASIMTLVRRIARRS